MYALCVSGTVNTQGFVWKFFLCAIYKFSFIHSYVYNRALVTVFCLLFPSREQRRDHCFKLTNSFSISSFSLGSLTSRLLEKGQPSWKTWQIWRRLIPLKQKLIGAADLSDPGYSAELHSESVFDVVLNLSDELPTSRSTTAEKKKQHPKKQVIDCTGIFS